MSPRRSLVSSLARLARLAPFASLLAVLLAPATATATPGFPGVIQSTLSAKQAPDCAVCHVGPQQRGTVTTAFGKAMRERGLEAFDEESLKTALAKMTQDKVDSNKDGQTDTDALKEGKDPNAAPGSDAGASSDKVLYGCVGSVAPGSPGGAPAVLLGLATVLALALSRQRRAKKSSPEIETGDRD